MEMALNNWAWLLTGAAAGFVAYCNLPSAWILPASKATASWLAEAKVRPLLPGKGEPGAEVTTGDLWKGHAGE